LIPDKSGAIDRSYPLGGYDDPDAFVILVLKEIISMTSKMNIL
jgi:hypothetical protein